MRSRVPAHITESTSRGFGLDVEITRSPAPKVNHLPVGDARVSERNPFFSGYREVIPPGQIGSEEGVDPQLPPSQYIDTVPSYPTEQNDTRLHAAVTSLRAADTQSIPLQDYASFQPRTAPLPRAAQEDLYHNGYGELAADPLMTDRDSKDLFPEGRHNDNRDLYGKNRDGVLHNPVGAYPAAPMIPSTTAAAAQSVNRQVGRGQTRTPHGQRPPELADQPISTAKFPAAKGK
jgi:hypothetical protein